MDTGELKAKFQQTMEKVDAMSLRERVLLMAVIVVIIIWLWFQVLMNGLEARNKQLTGELTTQRQAIVKLDEQAEAIVNRHTVDPDKENKEKIAKLKPVIKALDERLKNMTVDLIDPVKMAKVLEEVLTRETDLELVRIETLAAQPLIKIEATPVSGSRSVTRQKPASGLGNAYRHGLVLHFKGSYLSTLKYLRALEKLPHGLYWVEMEIETENYPVAKVSITVQTLSLTEGWIGT